MQRWMRLSDEILLVACADYAKYLNDYEKTLSRTGRGVAEHLNILQGKIDQVEKFFHSTYGAVICPDCNMERVMKLVQDNRKNLNRRWRCALYRKAEEEQGERWWVNE